ncbi:uncharacterized protein LOC125042609 [Penaeus chinensis]|uniref:uncharacterized protein LOC125042609 n=1 Tax=Penaeus chinensis TaxID=139456 RepID=UPI001FB82086|nr:uncharacterized protein LOC125042609 [Penaeus chinensis]
MHELKTHTVEKADFLSRCSGARADPDEVDEEQDAIAAAGKVAVTATTLDLSGHATLDEVLEDSRGPQLSTAGGKCYLICFSWEIRRTWCMPTHSLDGWKSHTSTLVPLLAR